MVFLAFYKGPAPTLTHKIAHHAVAWWTNSLYSHCELVVDGLCYSASARDNAVRSKNIDLTDGKWDLVPVRNVDVAFAKDHYEKTKYHSYDWAGVGRFVIPKLPLSDTRWYCSEWCAAALKFPEIEFSPETLCVYARYLLD